MITLGGAALAVALLVWATVESPERRLDARLAGTIEDGPAPPRTGRRSRLVAVVLAGLLVGGMLGGGAGLAAGLIAFIVTGTAALLIGRARRRRRAGRAAAEIARAAEELSGLLRVGGAPAVALTRVAEDCPALADAAALHAVGGDPVVALLAGAAVPGQEGLGDLAAAWQVATRTGAPMSRTLEAIADELARREELRSVVAVELAATRTAGLVLAVLPAAGLALGYALQGDPIGFLTREPVGQACLVLATALVAGGLIWTDTLTERAAR